MNAFSFFAALGITLAVSACTTVLSGVTNFSDPAVSYSAKSFAFHPSKEQALSLEYQDYAGYVASKLAAQGMVQAPLEHADFAVLLRYGVDGGRTVSGTTPIYGQTGGGEAAHSGTVYGPDGPEPYSGTGYTPETFGVVDEIEWSKTDYTRKFRMTIVDGPSLAAGKPRPAYQANAFSIGQEKTFYSVSRCVIDAVFDRFPDASGNSRIVSARGDTCMR